FALPSANAIDRLRFSPADTLSARNYKLLTVLSRTAACSVPLFKGSQAAKEWILTKWRQK
ncbi:MAG: hypothetical protein ACI9KE_004960, partial [Polyangiales bacterium]